MEGQLGTVEIIITIIGGCAAIIGGLFRFYVINKRDRDARFRELEARHNRQRAEDIARQEAQRAEDMAQRTEETREIKDQIYNHLPTQIKAVEDGLRKEMRETEKRIIDRMNELFAAYFSKDKDDKED